MLKRARCHLILTAVACAVSAAVYARAEAPRKIDVPAGELAAALRALAQQSDVNVMYAAPVVSGVHTKGVKGEYTLEAAVVKLLEGTQLDFFVADTGALLIRPLPAGEHIRIAQGANTTPEPAPTRLAVAAERSAAAEERNSAERSGLETVTVTAQKREERAIDVPLSITALSGETLTESGISNALDLSFAVPSMSVAEIQPGNQMIVIRGIGGERGGSALTGIYLDEIPLTGSTSGNNNNIDLRAEDLKRAEVLKGPQGTLFGEGSVGGTVRYITNDPRLDRFEGRLAGSSYVTSDGDPSYDVDAVINIPVVENVFGLRVAAAYENRGGWIDKVASQDGPVIEENFNDNETREVRIKGLWTPTDKLTLKPLVALHRTDGGGGNLVNVDPVGDSNFQPAFTATDSESLQSDYDLYNLTATYDMGFAELVSSTSQAEIETINNNSQVFLGGTQAAPVLVQIRRTGEIKDTSAFSQELRLTSTGTGPFKWTLGGYYKDSETISGTQGGLSAMIGGNPLIIARGAGILTEDTSKAWAAFTDASFTLMNRLEIGGGVRYFEDERATGQVEPLAPETRVSGTFDKVTYRAFASFAITDSIKVYANTATGFRSGGFNAPANIARGAPAGYEPETVKSYEAGIKTAFLDGRLRADLAVFTSDYVDIQADSQATIDGVVVQFTQNPGEATVEGVELSLDWMVTDRWTVGLSGDVTDTEITKIDTSGRAQPVRVGDRLNFVPDYSYSLSSTYGFQWARGLPGHFRIDFNEQGKSTDTFRGGLNLNPVNTAPTVRFLNVALSADWNDWNFGIFARNLLDEDKTIRPGNTDINTQARPRSMGVTVSKKF